MTNNQINNRIKDLEKQMNELKPKIKKQSRILGIAIPGGVSLFGLIAFLLVLMLFIVENQSKINNVGTIVAMIAFGFIFLFSLFVGLTGIPHFKEMLVMNQRYNKLENEKKSLQKKLQQLEREKEVESNEDLLLRLLSENKITLEEYKQLSKK